MFRLRHVFTFLLMIFATFTVAMASSLSVDQGPSITTLTDSEVPTGIVETDSLLVAELGVRYDTVVAARVANRTTSDTMIVSPASPSFMEVGALSGSMLSKNILVHANRNLFASNLTPEGATHLGYGIV